MVSSLSSRRTLDRPGDPSWREKRNRVFQPGREPFQDSSKLQIRRSHTTGPISFLNPTNVHFRLKPPTTPVDGVTKDEESPLSVARSDGHQGDSPGVHFKWTSRNNRKGRHALAVDLHAVPSSAPLRKTSSSHEILRGVSRMFTYYPVWDVSYVVAVMFTLGSIVWVLNAFFVYLPLVQPSSEFATESLYGGGITAFIGATIFEIGSLFLMAEAVNENRTGCFGWAVEQLEDEVREKGHLDFRLRPSNASCAHHHRNKHNFIGKSASLGGSDSSTGAGWVWWPTWYELRAHYFRELGFLACLSQLSGATVFWISGFTALPGIYDHLSPGLLDGIYWTPQVVGGTGFIISGTLFMIETQSKWYAPAFGVLGWHIGFWNLVGGIGFTLCPAFGFDTSSWAQYEASLSTFWGSWAFLIGSIVQWYESLDKHPVEQYDLSSREL